MVSSKHHLIWAKNPILITDTLIRTWCVVPDVITSVRSKTTRLPRKSLANILLFVNISLTRPLRFNGFMAFRCLVYHHQMLHIRMGLIVRHIARNSVLILWFFDQTTIRPQFDISNIRSIRTKHTYAHKSTCPIFFKKMCSINKTYSYLWFSHWFYHRTESQYRKL